MAQIHCIYICAPIHTEKLQQRWTGACWNLMNFSLNHIRPCGLMDKAPDFGSGDCRFESCRGQSFCGKNAYVLKSLFPIILGTWSDSLRQKQIPLWYFILSQNRKHVLQHILQHMRHLQFLMRNSISKKEAGRLMHLRIIVVLQL